MLKQSHNFGAFFHVNKESLRLANAYGQDWVTHICCLWFMMIYYCFRNSIHVNTDVPKPYARLCFKHMLFHMMLMHRYFLPRTHKPFPELQWLFGFSEMIYPGMGFPTVRQWSIRGWIQWWSEWCSLLNGHAGGGRKFPHDIAGFYPHQISMVFPWNPHQSLNPNHIHVLYIYMYTYII